jgi:hypothetical protein
MECFCHTMGLRLSGRPTKIYFRGPAPFHLSSTLAPTKVNCYALLLYICSIWLHIVRAAFFAPSIAIL